jgi:hypothetical protein
MVLGRRVDSTVFQGLIRKMIRPKGTGLAGPLDHDSPTQIKNVSYAARVVA